MAKEQEPRKTSDAVRQAVDQAFQATAGQGAAAAESGRERAQDIVDQLTQAAGRVREVLDELRPPTVDELKLLQKTVADLEQRVSALEEDAAQAQKPTPKPKAKRPPAKAKAKAPAKAKKTD